jgi:hypothetical protein
VTVQALTTADVVQLMPVFHPLYVTADPELLLFIDDHFGHGNLRNWAAFTHTANGLLAKHHRRLDEQVARNAFALHGGGTKKR